MTWCRDVIGNDEPQWLCIIISTSRNTLTTYKIVETANTSRHKDMAA